MDRAYVETVRLLLEATPAVFRAPYFAMKGGTALNLFVQEMPRLSVDLDVVYVPHATDRSAALDEIGRALATTRERLSATGIASEIISTKDGDDVKLLIRRGQSQVKVEVNHVFRGTLLPTKTRRLVKNARNLFTHRTLRARARHPGTLWQQARRGDGPPAPARLLRRARHV